MAIRAEADQYFKTVPEERDLATRLGEVFDITFRTTHENFSLWLAAPQRHTKERFGLQREILVLYSPHAQTDTRVLVTIEHALRHPDFKQRIERVVFLLIHAGDPNDTNELLGSQTARIIIPIHVSELTDPQRGSMFLRSRIVQYMGRFDLFDMASAIIADEYFFGRNDLVQTLTSRSTIRKESSGVFGLRKTGKTSILHAVQRRLTGQSVLVEYIDCSNPGIHSARWWQVLETLAIRCTHTLKRDFRRDVKLSTPFEQATAGAQFATTMKQILDHGRLDQIILMLDEVEYVTHGLSGALGQHWDQDFVPFWQTIRATHQETLGRFTFVVAGVNPVCIEESHFGTTPNPIFQLAVPHYLEPFTVAGVRDMVRSIGRYSGLQFDEEVYPYLQKVYGGHPFLIRVACSELWKATDTRNPQVRTTVTVQHFENLQADIQDRLTQPI